MKACCRSGISSSSSISLFLKVVDVSDYICINIYSLAFKRVGVKIR
jgi:hypothetical protein